MQSSPPEQLMENALARKNKKYVEQNGLEPEAFKCLAVTDCGLLHEDTKRLISVLAARAHLNPKDTRDAFRLAVEKFNAYTVVCQLRDVIPHCNWIGGLSN